MTHCSHFLTLADKEEEDRKQMGIDFILAPPPNVGSLVNLGSGDNRTVEQRTDSSWELALLQDQTKQPEYPGSDLFHRPPFATIKLVIT